MKTKASKSLREAIFSVAEEFPSSVVTDMLAYFPPETVVRFVEIFSGRNIHVPTVDSIWRCYRNRIVFDTLTLKDTRAVREQLAHHFGISPGYVGGIYKYMGDKKRPIRRKAADETSARIQNYYDATVSRELRAIRGKRR